jgi:hypothetical protein
MVETAAEYTEIIEGEEFVEVTGGGDFNKTFEFAKDGESSFVGIYKATEEKTIKGKERTLHTFEIDGEDFTVWGAAILDNRLEPVDVGSRCKVIKTGKKLQSASGNQPWEFKVLVSRSALG